MIAQGCSVEKSATSSARAIATLAALVSSGSFDHPVHQSNALPMPRRACGQLRSRSRAAKHPVDAPSPPRAAKGARRRARGTPWKWAMAACPPRSPAWQARSRARWRPRHRSWAAEPGRRRRTIEPWILPCRRDARPLVSSIGDQQPGPPCPRARKSGIRRARWENSRSRSARAAHPIASARSLASIARENQSSSTPRSRQARMRSRTSRGTSP